MRVRTLLKILATLEKTTNGVEEAGQDPLEVNPEISNLKNSVRINLTNLKLTIILLTTLVLF